MQPFLTAFYKFFCANFYIIAKKNAVISDCILRIICANFYIIAFIYFIRRTGIYIRHFFLFRCPALSVQHRQGLRP